MAIEKLPMTVSPCKNWRYYFGDETNQGIYYYETGLWMGSLEDVRTNPGLAVSTKLVARKGSNVSKEESHDLTKTLTNFIGGLS